MSHALKNYFAIENIDVLEFPPYSPDMNIIENLWAELVRKIYANGRQYTNVAKLKTELRFGKNSTTISFESSSTQ